MNKKMTAEKAIEQLNSLMNDRENHVHRDDFDEVFLQDIEALKIGISALEKLVKERNEAFMEAIMNDKWDKVKAYCKKYNIPLPNKSKTMKAGIYKAVQYRTDIPKEVKTVAMHKCLKLGFPPSY